MERNIKNYLSLVPQARSLQGSTEAGTNREAFPDGDYVARGLTVVMPDACFPNMVIGDKANHPWPYLGREVDHNWYCDRRSPQIGFLNRDEALLLHNLALQFRGKPGLEIGCWKGWSTCHVALAGVVLDVVDPILAEEAHLEDVRDSLAAAGVLGNVRLYGAASPDAVRDLAKLSRGKWNFFFVDGDHKGAAPARDAEACVEHAAEDAMIVFHDLMSQDVEQGLQLLQRKGWNVRIYQTMRIMGVAWRGSAKPVAHLADPSIHWTLPNHLTRYPVSGESAHEEALRLSQYTEWFLRESFRDHQKSVSLSDSVMSIQAEISLRDCRIEALRAALSASNIELEIQNDRVAKLGEQIETLVASLRAARRDINDVNASLASRETVLTRYLERIAEKDSQIKRLFLKVEKLTDEIARLSSEFGRNRPAFQVIVGSTLWRKTQPMRRLRASRAAPRLNGMLLSLACRVLRAVRLEDSAKQSKPLGLHRDQVELFDAAYYREMNPDVARSGVDPFFHYMTQGALEGRDPHPLFDTSFYYQTNPQVKEMGLNPLLHYITQGAAEERDPHPLFDISFYKNQKPQIRGLAINPLVHYLNEGPTIEFDPFSPSPELPDEGICIVTPDIVGPVKNGGIGTACYHFARLLSDAGHAVTVLFSGDVSDCQKAHWRNYFARFKIRFIALSDTDRVEKPVYGSTWFYERSWRIFDYLRNAHYSVIHFQDLHANGFWSIKAKRVGLAFEKTSLTLMVHSCTKWINEGMEHFSADPLETAKLVWAETYCMEHCDVMLSPSRYMIDWVASIGVQLPARTQIVPYVWTENPEFETHADVPVDSDHLIFFGRLETRKGLHIFCDAIRKSKAAGAVLPRKISFLGKLGSVRAMAAAEFLESFQSDLPEIEICIVNEFDYRQALEYIRNSNGLIVICSIVDNCPMTVIESIQHKRPFLAAATGGIPELVNEQITFEPTVDALANCLMARSSINHKDITHKYSPAVAGGKWRELNFELLACSSREQNEFRNTVEEIPQFPIVSVCIPYFNHFQYLETLMAAIASQNYPALEVVLVNDGSDAESSGVFNIAIRNNRDPRYKFLSMQNQGPGAARNRAAAASSGELLLFFDADNLPKDSGFVSTLVRAIHRSGADCVTAPYDIVGSEKVHIDDQDIESTYRPTGPCLEAGFFENVLGDATMIVKRGVFEAIGGFPTERASWEDHEFLLTLCLSGYKLETLPDSAFFYRQSSAGRNQRANEFQNYTSLFERLQAGKSVDLARIIASIGGPMLMARPGSPAGRLLAQ